MGGILPPNPVFNIDDWVERWLKAFFGSAFFAPILMIAIGLAIELMKFTMSLGKGTTGLGVTDSLLQLILMVICIVIFQKSVEYSATLMDGVGQRAAAIGARMGGKMMSAGIARPAAALTRNTLGRGLSYIAGKGSKEGGWLDRTAKKDSFVGGGLAKFALKNIKGFDEGVRNSSMDVMGRGTALMSLGTVNNIRANQGSLVRDDERIEKWKEQAAASKQTKEAMDEHNKAETLKAEAAVRTEDKAKLEQDLAQAKSKAQDLRDEVYTKEIDNTEKIEKLTSEIEEDKKAIEDLKNNKDVNGDSPEAILAGLKKERENLSIEYRTSNDDAEKLQIAEKLKQNEIETYNYKDQIGILDLEKSLDQKLIEQKKLISEISTIKEKSQKAEDKVKATEKSVEQSQDQIESLNQIAAEQSLHATELIGTAKANQKTVDEAREIYKAKYRAGDDAENAVNSLSPRALAEMSGAIGAGNDAARAANKAKAESEYKAKVDKETAKNMKAFMATLEKNSHAAAQASTPRPATIPKPAAATTPKTASTPATTASTGGAGH